MKKNNHIFEKGVHLTTEKAASLSKGLQWNFFLMAVYVCAIVRLALSNDILRFSLARLIL